MNFASQEVLKGSDQLQVMADFLENLSRVVETEEEKQLCYSVAEECRVAATTYVHYVAELTPGNAA
jgi:hypothetical protein